MMNVHVHVLVPEEPLVYDEGEVKMKFRFVTRGKGHKQQVYTMMSHHSHMTCLSNHMINIMLYHNALNNAKCVLKVKLFFS